MKDTPRRCAKCGKSTTKHPNLSMSRFPKPGSWNVRRVEAWAKFIHPDQNWSSNDLHQKLYRSHKMLCEDHFEKSAFIDLISRKLHRYAIPHDVDHNLVTQASIAASSSFTEHKNLTTEVHNVNTAEVLQPSTSAASSSTENKDLTAEVHNVNTRRKKQSTNKESTHYNKCRRLMRQVCKLKKQIRTKNKTDILKYLASDEAVEELSKKITNPFAVLLQGQLLNCKIKNKGRKWNIQQKLIALQLYKRSPACYRLLRRLFCLPCQTTLKNLLNLLPLCSGINSQIFDVLKKKTACQTPPNNECMLLFDEMSIRKHLNYNGRKDSIEGFQDHGTTQGRDPQIASHALVFMIVGIRKRFKQPIAYYLSGESVTADRLAVLIKEVLDSCFLAGINIAATVCDMDGVNRRALNILGTSFDHPYFEYNRHEIVALFDAPHLLKCFRNLFLKYNIKCQSGVANAGQPIKGVAKWSHISKFYDEDSKNPYFVFAPSLTKTHISPNNRDKMRVKLAAQVLSHTVAAGIYAKVSQDRILKEQQQLEVRKKNAELEMKLALEMKLHHELNERLAKLSDRSSELNRVCANFSSHLTITDSDQKRLDSAKENYQVAKELTGIRLDYRAPPTVAKGYIKSESRKLLQPFEVPATDSEVLWTLIQSTAAPGWPCDLNKENAASN